MFPQYEVSVVPTGSSGLIESHKLVPNFTKNQVEDFHASAMDMMRRGNFKAQTDDDRYETGDRQRGNVHGVLQRP